MLHDHAHGEGGHSHAPANYGRAFGVGIGLNLGFVAVEAVFGIAAGSMALLADAGHNLSDVLGLLLAWGAMVLSRKRPTARRTFGMRRSSILAALANAVLLLVAVGAIGWEAVRRFWSHRVDSNSPRARGRTDKTYKTPFCRFCWCRL